MNFQEEFLHFIWQFKLFGTQELRTTANEIIIVNRQGTLNKNAGPDFTNAKLEIAGTTWVGNIEVHIKASDWLTHQHQSDKAYENVILHIVYEDDQPIYRQDGSLIPVLVIKDLFPVDLLEKYEGLISSVQRFPCEKQIGLAGDLTIDETLSRLVVERLVQKSAEIEKKLEFLKGDWEETFYHFVAKNFGFKVNALPMEILAQSLSRLVLAKHKDNPLQIEALLFGQAGFLNQKFEDVYPNQLKREYQFLRKKYRLKPLDVSVWKFLRMRPQNFPTLRLAQFAALLVKTTQLFSKILAQEDEKCFRALFEELPVNPFWKTHYHFNKHTEHVDTQIGKHSIDIILINTISLFLFTYGKTTDQYYYVSRALSLLEKLSPEDNAIVRQFSNAGVVVKDALQSQALLELKKKYCNEKKCLTCGIGIKILRQ